MKIGFFTDSYVPRIDGIAISVETFRRELENLGHEVYVFAPKPGRKYDDKGKRVWRFTSWPSPWYEGFRESWPYTVKNAKGIRELNLDIIHTHTYGQIGLLGTYLAKTDDIPLVTTAHADFVDLVNEYGMIVPALFILGLATSIATRKGIPLSKAVKIVRPTNYKIKEWQSNFAQEMVGFYNRQCDLVIVPSSKVKDALMARQTTTEIRVVPTGVNINDLNSKISPQSLKREFGLTKADMFIQISGRLVKEKNVRLTIEAFSQIYNDFPNTYLVVVGEGPERSKLESIVKVLGMEKKVVFTGRLPRKKMFGLLRLADIYTHACLRETQGLAINEAVAAGKPVVLLDSTLTQVVQEGVNGFVAESNAHDYADKLSRLLKDKRLRATFGAKSLEISKKFEADIQARKLADLYTELLREKSKSKSKVSV